MIDLDVILLISALVLIAAIFAARLGNRFGLPALLLFLGIGMLLGDAVLGIRFDNVDIANAVGFGALVLILAEGGLTTKWEDIKSSTGVALVLATVGVAVSVACMTVFGHYVLHLSFATALLLGAVTSPTDAAAVFAVLRRVPLPHKIRGMLEGESGLNDAPTVLLVLLASAWAVGKAPHESVFVLTAIALGQLAGGLAVGGALGWLGSQVLRRVTLPSSGLYALAALGWTVLSYAAAGELHLSGFAAVYVCGLLLGNAKLPYRMATRAFVEGIGWIAQIGLFVMLGLLASPKLLRWNDVAVAVAAGLFLTVVARPLSVLLSTSWFRIGWRDQVFLSWAGLRGAVPIVLCTIPLARRVPDSQHLFDVVLIFVIVFTVLQAPALPWLANRLGLADRGQVRDVEVEVAPLERMSADLMQLRIPVDSKLNGVEIGELRLGRNAAVSLIIRDDQPMVPGPRDLIRTGDELLVVTPSHLRAKTEQRIRAVARGGRPAAWRQSAEPSD